MPGKLSRFLSSILILIHVHSYLLAPQTSPMGGVGNPTARIVLLGSRSPQIWPGFYKDPDPFIFSEIVEFALSLTPTPKGQDVFNGLPHLQVYRLVRAASLAEIGQVQLANRSVAPYIMRHIKLMKRQILRSYHRIIEPTFTLPH